MPWRGRRSAWQLSRESPNRSAAPPWVGQYDRICAHFLSVSWLNAPTRPITSHHLDYTRIRPEWNETFRHLFAGFLSDRLERWRMLGQMIRQQGPARTENGPQGELVKLDFDFRQDGQCPVCA